MAGWQLKITVFFFTFLWSITTLLRLSLAIICNPKTAFKKKKRTTPPDCLIDKSLGTHQYVTANGIKFHYVAAGDSSKPLMLLLHGFPEFWFSWRYQLKEFSNEYYVVAVDLRGYGDSEKPPNKSDYTLDKLHDDAKELILSLGYDKCTVVGHDWGGIIAWRVVQRYPELFEKAIIMNCPHAKVFYKQIMLSGWAQFLKSWYMFMFQLPALAEFTIQLFDYRMLSAMFRGKRAGACNRDAFPPDVIEAYKYIFSQPGALTPPINYIRNVFNISQKSKTPSPKMVTTPILLIWGDKDFFLETEMADKHGDICTDITVRHIPDCSHWVQQDNPQLVNQYMREFLNVQKQSE